MKQLELDPAKDGVTHIRIHRTAKSRIGRYMATCALTPFSMAELGRFASIDALRILVATGNNSREVRELALERAEREVYYTSPELLNSHPDRVAQALECKLDQTKIDGMVLRKLFDKTTLPFVCYTVFDGVAVVEDLPACIEDYLRRTRSSYYVHNYLPPRKRAVSKVAVMRSRSKLPSIALAR